MQDARITQVVDVLSVMYLTAIPYFIQIHAGVLVRRQNRPDRGVRLRRRKPPRRAGRRPAAPLRTDPARRLPLLDGLARTRRAEGGQGEMGEHPF